MILSVIFHGKTAIGGVPYACWSSTATRMLHYKLLVQY